MLQFFLIILLTLASICGLNATTAPVKGETVYSTAQHTFSFYPAQLCGTLNKIQQLEEVCTLIQRIKTNGRIGIEITVKDNFKAMWDSTNRVISINPNCHSNEGTLIVSLLFELHNADSDEELKAIIAAAQCGSIDKETFVYRIEKMEHTNCLKTCAILTRGVKLGIFPKETRWDIFYTFEEHYQVQQITGHSLWLAQSYDRHNPKEKDQPFQGTIKGLLTLTGYDRAILYYYLKIKNGLKSRNPFEVHIAHKKLQNEYTRLARGHTRALVHPLLQRRQALFRSVFTSSFFTPH